MLAYEIFEALMLLCFSIGWYWSIARMIRVQAAIGKSMSFVMLITAGYALGVSSKLLAWQAGAPLSPLVWLYAWNMLVTATDLALVIYFTRRGRVLG